MLLMQQSSGWIGHQQVAIAALTLHVCTSAAASGLMGLQWREGSACKACCCTKPAWILYLHIHHHDELFTPPHLPSLALSAASLRAARLRAPCEMGTTSDLHASCTGYLIADLTPARRKSEKSCCRP